MKSKICIVASNYYSDITQSLYNGSLSTLKKNGINKIDKIYVPGSFEIPVLISKNINSYEAFIALGCIIKGKTPHFDFISSAITNAIMEISIKYKKPIGNGIITCLNKNQAIERADVNKINKGGEAAIAVLSVLGILKDE